MYKINHSISLDVEQPAATIFKIHLMLQHELFLCICSHINMLMVDIELFDQIILLYKRLVGGLLSWDYLHKDYPCLNRRLMTQSLQLFLVQFCDQELPTVHSLFLRNFIPNVVQLYWQDPGMLALWFESQSSSKLCSDDKKTQLGFPLYSVLELFLFGQTHWQFADGSLLQLVALSDDYTDFRDWFVFESRFKENMIELMQTIIDGPRPENQFNRYATLYVKVAYTLKNDDLRQIYMDAFRLFYNTKFSTLKHFEMFVKWFKRLCEIDHPDTCQFAPKLINEDIFEEMVVALFTCGEEVLILDLIQTILNVPDLVGSIGQVAPLQGTLNLINRLRSGAMVFSKTEGVIVSDLLISKLHTSQTCLVAMDPQLLLPSLFRDSAANFFRNKTETNRCLILLLVKTHGSTAVDDVIEFLYSAYEAYEELTNEEEMRKYGTMNSGRLRNRTFRHNPPPLELQTSTYCLHFDDEIEPGLLLANMGLFRRCVVELYVDTKIRILASKATDADPLGDNSQ